MNYNTHTECSVHVSNDSQQTQHPHLLLLVGANHPHLVTHILICSSFIWSGKVVDHSLLMNASLSHDQHSPVWHPHTGEKDLLSNEGVCLIKASLDQRSGPMTLAETHISSMVISTCDMILLDTCDCT